MSLILNNKCGLVLTVIILNLLLLDAYDVNLKPLVKKIKQVYRKIGQFVGLKETCSEKWINSDRLGLESILKKELLGQEIAVAEIPALFDGYWKSRINNEPLLLCFYGSSGTGKTFTTKLLSKYIFSQGDKSYYYHYFSGAIASSNVEQLKADIKTSIEEALSECPFSIIVFDEVDAYPHGFLDSVLLPFLSKNLNDKSAAERAIFIFLTNIGSKELMEKALQIHNSYFYSNTMYNFAPIKLDLLIERKDSFYSSIIVQHGYIKEFIPFLPHKKETFKACLEKVISSSFSYAINNEDTKSEIIRNVLSVTKFIPEHDPVYVSHGCKRLESLIVAQISHLNLKRSQVEL